MGIHLYSSMINILELINKIKWDANEDPKEYSFYYSDRLEERNKEFKFREIKRIMNLFLIVEKNRREFYLPIHRINEVRKFDRIIWKR